VVIAQPPGSKGSVKGQVGAVTDGLTKLLPCQRHKNWVSLLDFNSFPTK
jgi:hypothetical protein